MSLNTFKTFVILSIFFYQKPTVSNVECYECSSILDDDCTTVPRYKVACSNYSTGCIKLAVETYELDSRIAFDKEQIYNSRIDLETIKKLFTPDPLFIVLRKCNEPNSHFPQPSGCNHIFDYKYNITVCKCESDLCNSTARQDIFLLIFICAVYTMHICD